MTLNETVSFRNETLKTINDRHSIRLYTDDPVSNRDLQTLVQAANQAPSAHNQQSWHFIVIKGEKKKELVELVNKKG